MAPASLIHSCPLASESAILRCRANKELLVLRNATRRKTP